MEKLTMTLLWWEAVVWGPRRESLPWGRSVVYFEVFLAVGPIDNAHMFCLPPVVTNL